MKKGHIAAVEFLERETDEALIQQGPAHIAQRTEEEAFDAFEI